MAQVTLSALAIKKVLNDPKYLQLVQDDPQHAIPLLAYYRRSYLTSKEGTVTEYGDGFTLSFVSEADIKESSGIEFQSVTIARGVDVIVGASDAMFSTPFSIDWSKSKFTFEPATSSA
jgi:hypothetical protein